MYVKLFLFFHTKSCDVQINDIYNAVLKYKITV